MGDSSIKTQTQEKQEMLEATSPGLKPNRKELVCGTDRSLAVTALSA